MYRLTPILIAAAAAAAQTASFEVASLKPYTPPANEAPMMTELRGRTSETMYDAHPPGWIPLEKTILKFRNRSLTGLIATAYRVRPLQVSGPSWMADARFDVDAVFPVGSSLETVDDMLKTLL